MRGERLYGEGTGHAHLLLALVGLWEEVLGVGRGGDAGVDLTLPSDARLLPLGVSVVYDFGLRRAAASFLSKLIVLGCRPASLFDGIALSVQRKLAFDYFVDVDIEVIREIRKKDCDVSDLVLDRYPLHVGWPCIRCKHPLKLLQQFCRFD